MIRGALEALAIIAAVVCLGFASGVWLAVATSEPPHVEWESHDRCAEPQP
jgi:hypothetical protein